MKLFALLVSCFSSALASVNVTKFDTPFTNTTYVIHGTPFLDREHCEEIYIPSALRSKFIRAEGLKYFSYKQGVCPMPYTKYTSKTDDSRVPGVTHYKRIKDSDSATASITLTPCACSGSQSMDITWSLSPNNPNPAKGSTVTVVGTGTLNEVLDSSDCGKYTIKASFGAIKLIDSSTSNCEDTTQSLPLGLGDIKSTAFTCPTQTGAATFSLAMPIPNLSGKVTASSDSSDGNGNCLFCVNMDMTL